MRAALAVLMFLVIAGCASFTATKTNDKITYPPTDPDKIEVLSSQPQKKFVKIGEVRAQGEMLSSRTNMIARLKEDAAEMGGDAVILKVSESEPHVLKDGQDVGSTYVYDFNKMYVPKMEGIVIKFNDGEGQ